MGKKSASNITSIVSNLLHTKMDDVVGYRTKSRWDKPDMTGFVSSKMYYKLALSIKPAYNFFDKSRIAYYRNRNTRGGRFEISEKSYLFRFGYGDETLVYLGFNPEYTNKWKTAVMKKDFSKDYLEKQNFVFSKHPHWKNNKRNLRLAVKFFYVLDNEVGYYDAETKTMKKWDYGMQEAFIVQNGFTVLSFRWMFSKINDKRVYNFLFTLIENWLQATSIKREILGQDVRATSGGGTPVLLGFVIKRIDVGYKVPVAWGYFSKKQIDRFRSYGLFQENGTKKRSITRLANVI